MSHKMDQLKMNLNFAKKHEDSNLTHLKVKSEFYRIKNMKFIENQRNYHDGVIGNTFEDLLGVDENNKKDPDFLDFEVKTKRQFSKAATSLFSLKPTYPAGGDDYMRNNWGIPDPEGYPHKVFRTSIYSHRWANVYSQYQMKLIVDRTNSLVRIHLCDLAGKLIDDSVYWSFSDLKNASLRKLKNTIVVEADEKTINGEVNFKFVKATTYLNFNFDSFLTALESGTVRYDNRLGIYRSGKNKGKKHNHGGAFRVVRASDLTNLFETYEVLT